MLYIIFLYFDKTNYKNKNIRYAKISLTLKNIFDRFKKIN